MFSLLLDEQISPKVEEEVLRKRPDISIASVLSWKEGRFLGTSDEVLLHAASAEHVTLVTYDQKTIPPLLHEWAAREIPHGGVIFIDNRTILPNNFGALIHSLIWLWDTQHYMEWENRIFYLKGEP